ncbi:MAG TPA: vWA domain-containing protein, partial [Acidimicrobiia bacterium]|nr:vWA domain-containing protein [Acidimicrobiia bacterium]
MAQNNGKADASRIQLYILLDRSGSMESIRDDVIGGFNSFIDEQRAEGPDARLTLVQFDTGDAHEILLDARPIGAVRPLSRRTFVPRGGTPLLDATGLLIARAAVRVEQRRQTGKAPEAVVFVTITDGQENSSAEYDRASILRLVEAKEAEGWSFAFLGAGLDAYAEAGGMGYDTGSVQAFAADGMGAKAAWGSLSRATSEHRRHVRAQGAPPPPGDFFKGLKEAEI